LPVEGDFVNYVLQAASFTRARGAGSAFRKAYRIAIRCAAYGMK
jgi:hypothetical protein